MRWATLCLALGMAPAAAGAHPLDEVVQGAYLTLSPGTVRLELDITPGVEVAAAFLPTIDANRDRRISEAEARFYAQRVLGQTRLSLDGAAAYWRIERVVVPPYAALTSGGDTLKIYAAARRGDRQGRRTLSFENRYQPGKTQVVANIFLQPSGGWRFQVEGQQRSPDGRRYTAVYVATRR